jgi:hypothetical protein
MNDYKEQITFLINQNIKKLKSEQNAQGYFVSQSSSNTSFNNSKSLESTFITSFILLCMYNLPTSTIRNGIIENGINFLLRQKSKNWSFNNLVRKSQLSQKLSFPDNLDCSFCALSAIALHSSTYLTGKVMANVITLLTALEMQPGGPYRTWLVPESADLIWKDVDPAVNANIAYFLSLQKINLPKLTTFIENSIIQKQLRSSYYESILPVIYFISRFYKGHKLESLVNILDQHRNSPKFVYNPLRISLVISSLLNINAVDLIKIQDIEYLISTSKNEWYRYPFMIEAGSQKNAPAQYIGSDSLTTIFCLEALAKYASITTRDQRINNQSLVSPINSISEHIYNQIVRKSEKNFDIVGIDLKQEGLLALHKTLKSDPKRQITLLPYYFTFMLGKNGKKISEELLIKLGIINLLGWVAYTIYDNFLDEEGNPVQLSVANFLLREITTIAENLNLTKKGFSSIFQSIMNGIDSANIWETRYCRIKIIEGTIQIKSLVLPKWNNYEKLAERSYGHALGPLAILIDLGFSEESQEMKYLREFFKHYLIARQLNDDAHDWEEDLNKGQLNPVVCLLIVKYQRQHRIKNTIKLSYLSLQLNGIFWNDMFPDVCKIILFHIKKAKISLNKIQVIQNIELFEKILDDLKLTTENAFKDQQNTIEFLEEFSN